MMTVWKQTAFCCARFLYSGIFVLATLMLASGCSSLPLSGSDPAISSLQSLRINQAGRDLQTLDEIDTVLKVNNRWLKARITEGLASQADASTTYRFQDINVTTGRQTISVDAILSFTDEQQNSISTSVSGEVLLDFSPYELRWSVQFNTIEVSSRDFIFEGGSYTEPVPELGAYLLKTVNRDLFTGLNTSGNNRIAINAVPLGKIKAGAELVGLQLEPAQREAEIGGVFLNAGSALLVDTAYTTFASKLVFLPAMSRCPADVSVSRAGFASDIESREPVGMDAENRQLDDIRYFFSEITGANEKMTIIHYWFANGKTVAVEELDVGASRRWRTWSSGSGFAEGDRLEVLVVKKDTGCILLDKAIVIPNPGELAEQASPNEIRKSFARYEDQFEHRLEGFSLPDTRPGILAAETRRSVINTALQQALSNVEINAVFKLADMPARQYTADLQPFDMSDLSCERKTCPPPPLCKIDIGHCKRFRDTRDCSSCLFRNPLNNRCISESVDPLCESSRDRQNRRYEAERAVCISNAEALKVECDARNAHANRSCKIEAGFADNACESVKSSILNLETGMPLAEIHSQLNAIGQLSALFSNIRLEGDMETLRLDVTLLSDLSIRGNMAFSPGDIASPLADCIADWSSGFSSRVASTPEVKNLQSSLQQEADSLVATWSGFGMDLQLGPSPLESILVNQPQLLANCKVGLTISKVQKAISNDDSGFLSGRLDLVLQPQTTRISLDPLQLFENEQTLSATATLSSGHVRYMIEN